MTEHRSDTAADFDKYATSYDHDLARGLAVTGENRDYYARRRIEWLKRCLDELGASGADVIEFGCGTGSNVPFLLGVVGAASVTGIDTSERSLQVADQTYKSDGVRFLHPNDFEPGGRADLIFCNGVFHHIPPVDRVDTMRFLMRCLRQGGLLALWENNPWNPGTRYVMSRVSFDRDAITISSSEAQRLVQKAGFEVLRKDFLFIFPRFLRWLRVLEPSLSRFPIGGQYEVLCRKP
jgi:SAM-dependent methyltransferase